MNDWWQSNEADRPAHDQRPSIRSTSTPVRGNGLSVEQPGGTLGRLGANSIAVGAVSGTVASVVGLLLASVINGRMLGEQSRFHLGVRTIAVAFLVGAMLAGWGSFTAGQTRLGLRRGLVAGTGTAAVAGLLLPLADRLWRASRADDQPGSLLVLIGAWVVIGALAGGVAGLEDGPSRARNGFVGGLAGGLVGGVCFAALSGDFRITETSSFVSQLVGYTVTTLGIGLGVGLTERIARSAWLVAIDGPQAGREFILYRDVSTIGTADDCQIYLRSDSRADAHHAEVTVVDGRMVITPLDGPVDVDRKPFAGGPVDNGSVIRVGNSYLRAQVR